MHIFFVNSYAVEPDEFLQNSKQELRARNISKNVRCLVCQNQSIDESSAPLAKDLRILIRKKIKDGNTDDEIYKFLFDRYGLFLNLLIFVISIPIPNLSSMYKLQTRFIYNITGFNDYE